MITKDYIETTVRDCIAGLLGVQPNDIRSTDDLAGDWYFDDAQKMLLARYLTEYFNADGRQPHLTHRISADAMLVCRTVQDIIDLIYKRENFASLRNSHLARFARLQEEFDQRFQ